VCDWLELHKVEAQSVVTTQMTSMSQEQLFSIRGKKAFRRSIRDALNKWLEHELGERSIRDVYFPMLIMS
jgi:flagellar basal body-associated protein FliL